ncbi:hypothetical protein CLG96_04160 [Sphingomonas oleivorans]|uniref:Uncharacterized protein n=1 Tax=Sphingomonas oleivorans TaxID=1735121 RepID=A0A2T5G2D4_9SPHN|nr:hypothetical protein [Sphingomonas oleivorans]PTQ13307.1 hypothetical protein CLG96_04160 [Sphingomonas oleivorans]
MPDAALMIIATSLMALLIISQALLRGWRGWLDLRRLEIGALRAPRAARAGSGTASLIELADLQERVCKLEGIAASIDF